MQQKQQAGDVTIDDNDPSITKHMPGFCPLLIAAKVNAMAENAAEREINLHHAARIEIAGPLRRQKDDAATFNFDFWPLQYRRGDVFISQSTESRLERNRREGLCERLKSGPEPQDLRHSTIARSRCPAAEGVFPPDAIVFRAIVRAAANRPLLSHRFLTCLKEVVTWQRSHERPSASRCTSSFR
jgi:hypothetical protein